MLAQAQDERSTLALPASSSETLAQRMHKLMAPSPGPHDYASLLAAAGPGFSLDLPTRQFDPSRLPMDPRSGHTPAQLEALGFAAPSSVEQLQAFQRMLGTPPRVPAPIDPIKDPGRVALSQLPMDNSGYSPAQLASMEASTRPKDMPLGLHMLFTGPGNFLFRKPGEGGTDILSREGGPSVGAAQAAPSDSNTPYNLPSAPLGIPADPPASPSGLAAPFARPVHPLNLKSSRTAPWPGDPPRATRAATPGTARAVPPKPDSAPPATTASSPPPADDEDAPPPFDQESSFANLLKLYGPAPKMAKTSDEARAKERNDDIGMALLSAGAKGLASRSPTFLGSLGAAAEGAIPALADSAKERKAREREDRQSDFEQQKTEYGARTQAATATMEEKRAMRANDISLKQLRLQRATLEETTRNNKAQLEGEKERTKQALDIAYAQIAAGQKNFGDREVAILTAGSKPGATPDQVYAAAAVRELISASNPFGQYGTTPAALKTVEEGLVKQLSIATRAGIPTASIEAELADVRAKLKGVLSPTKGNSVDYGALK